MNSFDLDQPLFELGSGNGAFSIRNSLEHVLITGTSGAGKSSGPAKYLIIKYLAAGYGGLVLTAKEEEKSVWEEYARTTGRSQDLIILEANGKHAFNFLQYEAESGSGGMAATENLVSLLKTVILASNEKDSGKSEDPFWESALDMLLYNLIDLCKLAYRRLSVQLIYDIAQTIPKKDDSLESERKNNPFNKAFEAARRNVTRQIDSWIESRSEEERKLFEDEDVFEEQLIENIPDARLLRFLDQFFLDSFRNLSDKTRSIIDFSLSNFLLRLLREPVYSLLCRHPCTFRPEDCFDGKIVIINLPVQTFQKIGRDCQILLKYIFQRSWQKRDINKNGRPVFLFADESQNFLHDFDSLFQAIARSSRVANLFVTQNLPNYFASMGGQKSEYRVKSLLGTFGCKIFSANSDADTNKYASELIGEAYLEDFSMSTTVSDSISQTRGKSLKLQHIVRPEQFQSLRTGGPINNCKVDAYIHLQGAHLLNGRNHIKMAFNQNYQP